MWSTSEPVASRRPLLLPPPFSPGRAIPHLATLKVVDVAVQMSLARVALGPVDGHVDVGVRAGAAQVRCVDEDFVRGVACSEKAAAAAAAAQQRYKQLLCRSDKSSNSSSDKTINGDKNKTPCSEAQNEHNSLRKKLAGSKQAAHHQNSWDLNAADICAETENPVRLPQAP